MWYSSVLSISSFPPCPCTAGSFYCVNVWIPALLVDLQVLYLTIFHRECAYFYPSEGALMFVYVRISCAKCNFWICWQSWIVSSLPCVYAFLKPSQVCCAYDRLFLESYFHLHGIIHVNLESHISPRLSYFQYKIISGNSQNYWVQLHAHEIS